MKYRWKVTYIKLAELESHLNQLDFRGWEIFEVSDLSRRPEIVILSRMELDKWTAMKERENELTQANNKRGQRNA